MTEQYYRDCMENAANYNSKLCTDRRLRLPFLDSQTGVAQNHTSLWHHARYRGCGNYKGQLYSYPPRQFRKKKRTLSFYDYNIGTPRPIIKEVDSVEAGTDVHVNVVPKMHQISTVENPAAVKYDPEVAAEAGEKVDETIYYEDWENFSEPLDDGEIDNHNSDSSDFEEQFIKKKKKKTKPTKKSSRRKRDDRDQDNSVEKPYSCERKLRSSRVCGARYKTRPGLSYHVTHSHNKQKEKPAREKEEESLSPQQPEDSVPYHGKSSGGGHHEHEPGIRGKGSMPSKYCDFCLGDEVENKKTGVREELVSCADCGRSGHPTCLQFTANMIISVKKYPWQCIECKSCGLCGTSDNDDQLLFCDDCDRGYHMYCLKPPLTNPPEGTPRSIPRRCHKKLELLFVY